MTSDDVGGLMGDRDSAWGFLTGSLPRALKAHGIAFRADGPTLTYTHALLGQVGSTFRFGGERTVAVEAVASPRQRALMRAHAAMYFADEV